MPERDYGQVVTEAHHGLVEIGARNRYEQVRAEPGMRDHWPPWAEASEPMRDTYRRVFAEWLDAVRVAEEEADG